MKPPEDAIDEAQQEFIAQLAVAMNENARAVRALLEEHTGIFADEPQTLSLDEAGLNQYGEPEEDPDEHEDDG